MCGIAGFINFNRDQNDQELKQIVEEMTGTLKHRGPNGSGSFTDSKAGIALGHRRLSIIDISEKAQQPMVSTHGRFVISYNGEIYNYKNIRQELDDREGGRWRSESDTEVLLTAFERWGIEKTLLRINGMFAIALWDRTDQRLWLIRDRLGEKPLYYAVIRNRIIFGSELKALCAHPLFNKTIDFEALTEYLRFGYVPHPITIYKDSKKLPPGTYLQIDSNLQNLLPVSYWTVRQAFKDGTKNIISSENEARLEIRTLLSDAVALRMQSDVPIGAFLSSGVDSPLVVAMMQARSKQKVRTFSIGIDDSTYNEAETAKAIAIQLGTNHTELYLGINEVAQMVSKLGIIYDEPFADFSQIPTLLVSSLASKSVKVCLSGDGGDEVFGGYNRYIWAPLIWSQIGKVPYSVRVFIERRLKTISPAQWKSIYKYFNPILPEIAYAEEKVEKLIRVFGSLSNADLYRRLSFIWMNPNKILLKEFQYTNENADSSTLYYEFLREMNYRDLTEYLPGDILVKLDRATMFVSLEGRCPYLDYRLLEVSARLQGNLKIRKQEGKWILRDLLSHYLPKKIIDGPKKGFTVPVGVWLRGPLRDWAETYLSDSAIRRTGIFNPGPIHSVWQDHLQEKENAQSRIWAILMLQLWLEENKICL